jgi:hypothetical protein
MWSVRDSEIFDAMLAADTIGRWWSLECGMPFNGPVFFKEHGTRRGDCVLSQVHRVPLLQHGEPLVMHYSWVNYKQCSWASESIALRALED